ncbi:MAG: DUF1573 domain-containing protein [Candidatus Bipolaricaulota bacterium]|nr:DUF1573 domain-containing protein [Candidatus Bipolaricaulota bacterium]
MKMLARWAVLIVTLGTVALAQASPPKIEVSSAAYDFGTIAGTAQVETTVSIHNAGESPLEILSVTTSCGCTKAQLTDEKIEPGQTTTLKIIFDASSHIGERKAPLTEPEAVTHVVYLRTNDPARPEVEIEIRAMVMPENLTSPPSPPSPQPSPFKGEGQGGEGLAVIYYNEACHDCTVYLDRELIPLLKELGIAQIVKKDYISERRNRAELLERSTQLKVPAKLQGHLTVFLGEKIILQGHVPLEIVRDLLRPENKARYERIVVLQDKMAAHGDRPTSYQVWGYAGEVKEYPIDTPIEIYLAELAKQQGRPTELPTEESKSFLGFLTLVLGAGLLDGINPCAFAVLLFFMAFLFTLQRARTQILQAGLVYIAAIYLTYLAIGLGILGVFQLGSPHLMAKLGAGLMIFLGLVNLKDAFWYGRWFSLGVLKVGAETRDHWMRKATLPATAVLGFLVGICEFPCTGGVYVGVLGLLAAQTTYLSGLVYLVLYNVMFVLPLIVLLFAVGNRRVMGQISRWEAQHKRALKLGQGLVMIALGVGILLWFV